MQPAEQPFRGQLGPPGPVSDVIHDLVACVVGNPNSLQSSPSSFFSWTWASISSATTSFFLISFSWSWGIFWSLTSSARWAARPVDRSKAFPPGRAPAGPRGESWSAVRLTHPPNRTPAPCRTGAAERLRPSVRRESTTGLLLVHRIVLPGFMLTLVADDSSSKRFNTQQVLLSSSRPL